MLILDQVLGVIVLVSSVLVSFLLKSQNLGIRFFDKLEVKVQLFSKGVNVFRGQASTTLISDVMFRNLFTLVNASKGELFLAPFRFVRKAVFVCWAIFNFVMQISFFRILDQLWVWCKEVVDFILFVSRISKTRFIKGTLLHKKSGRMFASTSRSEPEIGFLKSNQMMRDSYLVFSRLFNTERSANEMD